MQFGKLEDEVYPKLEAYGIKQIAQRTAGFDMYDLDLAKKHGIVISNIPSYSPETIAEYSVSIALQLVRRFLQSKDAYKITTLLGRHRLCHVQLRI